MATDREGAGASDAAGRQSPPGCPQGPHRSTPAQASAWRRRDWLASAGQCLALAAWPGAAAWAGPARAATPATAEFRLAAAWDEPAGGHWVGLLGPSRDGRGLQVLDRLELPSRAHGLAWEPAGSLLATARRPGDWMVRWSPGGGAAQWCWSAPDRRFTGHTLKDPEGQRLFSVETDLDSGRGLVVCRDPRTLEVRAEWPTHGIDPHQLIWGADGHLLVANGGVPTLPETGRTKRELDRMDPSLVRLDRQTGALRGQWRLADARLSIRHLARDAAGRVGVALQAEHDEPDRRLAAPVLALFADDRLTLAEAAMPLAGYGGDVAAVPDGFVVSAPRAGGVGTWTAQGAWRGFEALPEACALASPPGRPWWAAGGLLARQHGPGAQPRDHALPGLRLDNHWLLLDA